MGSSIAQAAKVTSGSKSKGLSFGKIWKSFWVTLIDPSSEEALRDDKADKARGRGSSSKKSLFKKPMKARKLK